jgi:hypothetical protein
MGGTAAYDHQQPQVSRFDRLAEVVWRGLTNEASSPSPSPPPSVPPSPTVVVPKFKITAPQPASNKLTDLGFGARFRDTLWKGVTNQVDSESPSPDPSPEPSPVASRSASPLLVAEDDLPNLEQDQMEKSGGGSGGSWFGGFGDSDAAAALAKTSTNLRVRAMDVLGRTSPKPGPKPQPELVLETSAPALSSAGSWAASLTGFRLGLGTAPEGGHPHAAVFDAKSRHGSLPAHAPEREVFASTSKDDLYSPPTRPPFFRPARDSTLPTASPTLSASSSISETSPNKGGAIQSALAVLTGSSILAPTPVKKSGPKPLLLNSRSLMTAPASPRMSGRPVTPATRSKAGGRTYRSVSSSRNNSVDQPAPGSSGVVPLRRGPVTSARMVGGPNAGRAAFNPRDSISSTGSNQYSDHRFSYEESSAGERDSKSYSLGRTKTAGFIVDRGMDSPDTVHNRDSTSTGTSGARTSPPQSLHPEEGVQERVVLNDPEDTGAAEQESDDERTISTSVLLRVDSDESSASGAEKAAPSQSKLRAKRHRDTSTLDLNSGALPDLGDHTVTSPPSAGFSSSLEPGVAYDDNDTTPHATTPTTPSVTIGRKGATVNRSRTPRGQRRPHKGTGEEGTDSPPTSRMSRRNGNSTPSRVSTALVSGSEEEGARADVEDELYTDLINSY